MAVLGPLLSTLTASARAALPYVRSMVEDGLSSTIIQRTLSDAGMGVRRTDLLALIRGLKDEELTRPYIDSLRMDVQPAVARLDTSKTQTLRDLSYTVLVQGTHLETGELHEQYITISTNDPMTKEQAAGKAIELADASMTAYGFSAHGARVTMITRAPGAFGL